MKSSWKRPANPPLRGITRGVIGPRQQPRQPGHRLAVNVKVDAGIFVGRFGHSCCMSLAKDWLIVAARTANGRDFLTGRVASGKLVLWDSFPRCRDVPPLAGASVASGENPRCSVAALCWLQPSSPCWACPWFRCRPVRPTSRRFRRFAPAEIWRGRPTSLESLKNTVASKEEYDDSEGKVGRESNTLAVIALALGLHDRDNKYKDKAPDLIKAAQDVAATKDYAAAKKGVAALEEAAAADGRRAANSSGRKSPRLPDLMKQVPMVNTKLKSV